MVEETELVNIGRLKARLKVTDEQLLDAVQSKKLTLVLNASGLFARPVERQLNGQYSPKGTFRLCEDEFMYVARTYLRRLDAREEIKMGFACTNPDSDADQWITLKGSDGKPGFRLDDLYVSNQAAKNLFDKDSPAKLRYDEGLHAAKSLLRLKHSEGKLRHDDDFARWMKNQRVIKFIRGNPEDYPECAKIKPKRSEGKTADKEPTLKRSFVGLFKSEELRAEFQRLISK